VAVHHTLVVSRQGCEILLKKEAYVGASLCRFPVLTQSVCAQLSTSFELRGRYRIEREVQN
jgi:hypothetical protein